MNDIVERLRDAQLNHNDFRFGWLAEASDEIERLRARVVRLEGALRFYADDETHEGGPTGPAPIDLDLGDRARNALESDTFMGAA